MNEFKIIVVFIVVLACGAIGGYILGGFNQSRADSGRFDELGKELANFRGSINDLQNQNSELTRLNRVNRDTITSARGLATQATEELGSGIVTIHESIQLVRSIKVRLSAIKSVLDGENLVNSDPNSGGGR